jgi:hypothetical protein
MNFLTNVLGRTRKKACAAGCAPLQALFQACNAELKNVHLYQATIRKAAQVLFRGNSLLDMSRQATIQSPTYELVQ